MADTIRVVRVEIGEKVKNEHGDFYRATVRTAYTGFLQIHIPVGDVIELTEERVRRHTEGVGWERRLISEWEAD